MCGRYTLHTQKQKLAKSIALELPNDYEPDYNISPGRNALTIKCGNKSPFVATMMNWGLRTPQNFHINARIESANTSPRFRESWHKHRCLLPANGFYEWFQDGVSKKPYYIYTQQEVLQFYAGIYFPHKENDHTSSFVVLTTEAQSSIKSIHNRMPVILGRDYHSSWLSGKISKTELQDLSAKAQLCNYTVSNRVNRAQNNDIKLIESTSHLSDDQMQLF